MAAPGKTQRGPSEDPAKTSEGPGKQYRLNAVHDRHELRVGLQLASDCRPRGISVIRAR